MTPRDSSAYLSGADPRAKGLADALASVINARRWSLPFTAVGAELLDSELPDSRHLAVTIVPVATEYQRADRQYWRQTIRLAVEIRQTIDTLSDAAPLSELTDRITEYLLNRPLTIAGTAEPWSQISLTRRRDQEILRQDLLLREIVELTYRQIGASSPAPSALTSPSPS